jgi:F-type H+-transporting ATPase subunit alpha
MLKKVAEGDWSEETQKAVESAVSSFAEDFGFDLDEEGHPLEDGDQARSRNGRREGRDESDGRSGSDDRSDSGDREREEQAQPA